MKDRITYYTYKNTPMGEVLLIQEDGMLVGLHWRIFRRAPLPRPEWIENTEVFDPVLRQLEEYYKGLRQEFDIGYELRGTKFQMDVWRELEKIPYRASSSYQAIAVAIGKPGAVRAVGTAIGSNPISILVPCHRVLTSDGRLGGYAGGLPAKHKLLQTEGILA